MTLDDLECQNRVFMDVLVILGCDNSIAFARCRHVTNSLCNADGDFGICILIKREHPSRQWAFIHALLSHVPFVLARPSCVILSLHNNLAIASEYQYMYTSR